MLRFLMNFLPEDKKRPTAVFPFVAGRLQAAYAVLECAS